MRLAAAGLAGRLAAGRPAGRLSWAGLWSAALHGAVLVALVWRPERLPPPEPAPAAVEVELVRQNETRQGAPPSQPAEPVQAPAAVPSPPAPSPPQPAAADAGSLPPPDAAAATPPPPVPDVPMPSPPPQPPAPPAEHADQPPVVNLGNGDADREALNVYGDDVVSEGPDSRYHNLPPHYPRDAARAHLHGSVALRIHIDPEGAPGDVDVVESSGVPSMDQSAVSAVGRWRFKPAVRDGEPVPSVYLIEFNFVDEAR